MAKQASIVNIANLTDTVTAQTNINNNFTNLNTAFLNTLSLDGSTPNQMQASLDLNSNRILNLPKPTNPTDPVRLQDVAIGTPGVFTANGATAISLTNIAPAGAHATVQTWLTVVDAGGNTRYIPCF